MWYFISPDIVLGEVSLNSLVEFSGKRALIVTDNNLVQIGIADRVSARLIKSGIEVQIFDKIEPDPTTEEVLVGVEAAHEYQPDWMVGLGGGSPIDAAKAIWVL